MIIVSALSQRKRVKRERELDYHDNFSMGGIREGKGLFFILFFGSLCPKNHL